MTKMDRADSNQVTGDDTEEDEKEDVDLPAKKQKISNDFDEEEEEEEHDFNAEVEYEEKLDKYIEDSDIAQFDKDVIKNCRVGEIISCKFIYTLDNSNI